MSGRCMENQKLINEKTLQRYIYEILTYGSKKKFLSLFPEKFKGLAQKKVKVIIPEYPVSYNGHNKHITDFRIIFTDLSYLNIEVEWQVSRFNHGKEVYDYAYSGTKGFILVVSNDRKADSFIDSDNISVLDAIDFSYWFLKKAKHIVDGTIGNYLSEYESRASKCWLVFLPSAGRNDGDSLNDYVLRGRSKGVWAFRYSNTQTVMKNILDITAGDTVIFAYNFKYGEGVKGRQLYPETEWKFTGLDILKVKKGYYCDLSDDTFEIEEWTRLPEEDKINSKRYMHYFQYLFPPADNNEKYFTSSKLPVTLCNDSSTLPGWYEFIESLRWSCSNQGAPAELSDEAMNALYCIIGDVN